MVMVMHHNNDVMGFDDHAGLIRDCDDGARTINEYVMKGYVMMQ